jgi:hypothetical protein
MLQVGSRASCINLEHQPGKNFLSGRSGGSYSCKIYSSRNCGGQILTVQGGVTFPWPAKAIHCYCGKSRMYFQSTSKLQKQQKDLLLEVCSIVIFRTMKNPLRNSDKQEQRMKSIFQITSKTVLNSVKLNK